MPDEEYRYEWSPVAQPEGSEETATMEGKNTDTLKLSHVSQHTAQHAARMNTDPDLGVQQWVRKIDQNTQKVNSGLEAWWNGLIHFVAAEEFFWFT